MFFATKKDVQYLRTRLNDIDAMLEKILKQVAPAKLTSNAVEDLFGTLTKPPRVQAPAKTPGRHLAPRGNGAARFCLEYMENHAGVAVHVTKLQPMLKKAIPHCGPQAAQSAMADLHRRGLLTRVGRGMYLYNRATLEAYV